MHLRPIELSGEDVQKYLGSMPTIQVDEYGNMPYNKDFIASKTLDEVIFIIAHETLHVALEHLWRQGSRNHLLFNIACDFAVNYLVDDSIRIPPGCLGYNDDSYRNKCAEEIYEELIKNSKVALAKYKTLVFDRMIPLTGKGEGKEQEGGEQGKQSNGIGKEGKLSKDSPFKLPNQEKLNPEQIIKEAVTFAKNQGKLPGGLERVFQQYFDTSMSWKELLMKYIMEILPKDFTYMKPSKRFCSTEVYLPSILKQEIDIVIAIDSSGSISEVEYSKFLSEVLHICKNIENIKGTIIICDANIQDIFDLDSNLDPSTIRGHGYGGTSCIPVFRWIKEEKEEHVKLLVYFTDGYIDEPTEDVYSGNYTVLWVVTKQGRTDFLHQNVGKQTIIKMEED